MKDFARLSDRPGELGQVATALSRWGEHQGAGRTGHRWSGDGSSDRRRADAARAALERANIAFEEDDVVTVLLENRPGELAAVTTKLQPQE